MDRLKTGTRVICIQTWKPKGKRTTLCKKDDLGKVVAIYPGDGMPYEIEWQDRAPVRHFAHHNGTVFRAS